MSADKRPSKAEVFAGWLEGRVHLHRYDRDEIAAELRRIRALEAERDQLRAEVDAKSPRLSCRHHGKAAPDEWACPTCLRELRADLAARKEADTRSTIAAWDQIKRLQGEARVLRDLLAEARAVLDTITDTDQKDAPDEMDKFLAAIDAALDPTSREAQQMSITEASKESP